MNDTTILAEALAFHGHKCWASTAGVRLGLAAMATLGATRAGAKQLHAIIETGDYHGGMCFGDGIQFTTGCTFGKGNIEKTGEGKFAVTLIDKASKRAVRVAYGRRSSRASRQRRSCRSAPRACRQRRSPTPSRWRWSTSSGMRRPPRS